jgi:hypothetical protein
MKIKLCSSLLTVAVLALSGCATTSMSESTYSGDVKAIAAEKTSGMRRFISVAFSTPMPAWQAPPLDDRASEQSAPPPAAESLPEKVKESTLRSYPVLQGEGESGFSVKAEPSVSSSISEGQK